MSPARDGILITELCGPRGAMPSVALVAAGRPALLSLAARPAESRRKVYVLQRVAATSELRRNVILRCRTSCLTTTGRSRASRTLQAGLNAWRHEYNTDRPHQSLNMAFPSARFEAASSSLQLRVPERQGLALPQEPGHTPASRRTMPAERSQVAVEADRLVPPSGNLQLGGQQVWLGPALAGRMVTIWVDEASLHVLLDRTRLKTLPSRLGVIELARLAADGARPAGPPPLPAGTGTAVEVERVVNAVGLIGLAGKQVNVGYELAGQRVTLRMDGTQMSVISHDGELLRTVPCSVPAADRRRLRGARRARPLPPQPGGPVTVQRRVSCRGSLMVARQKIHAGMIHAGKTATVISDNNQFEVIIDGETAVVVPRTTTSEIHRYKANATQRSVPGPAREGR